MGKAKKQQQRQATRPVDPAIWLASQPDDTAPSLTGDQTTERRTGRLDKHDLYQKAVQSPLGDISYLLKFFRQYVGLQVPLHFREEFSGTSLISAAWCKSDVRRTAVGVDIDREALQWGWRHNADIMLSSTADQLCLIEANVLEDLQACFRKDMLIAPAEHREAQQELLFKPADIVCAFNFSVFLLTTRAEVVRCFGLVKAAMNREDGSIFVLDMLGGHAAEASIQLKRANEVTGLSYLWEQERFDPVRRQLTCHISLKDPHTNQVLRHAFTYHWKLWTIPEVLELLSEAGFLEVHVWIRCMIGTDDDSSNGQDDVENDFEDYEDVKSNPNLLADLSKGWVAYLVAVLPAEN